MRTLLLTACLAATACLVPTKPKDTSEDQTAAPDTDAAPEAPPTHVVVEDPDAEPPDPIVPPAPAEGLKGVDVVGHGLRITLYPPFQVSRTDDFVAEFVEKGASNGLLLSWWDVSTPGVVSGSGMVGLYNAGVAVHPVPVGADTIVVSEGAWPNGDPGKRYRLGETGSYVLLPKELAEAGGMLTVQPGPAEPEWAMQAPDGTRTPLEERKIVHSADPAAGPGFEISGNPHQPWGPWPTSP